MKYKSIGLRCATEQEILGRQCCKYCSSWNISYACCVKYRCIFPNEVCNEFEKRN